MRGFLIFDITMSVYGNLFWLDFLLVILFDLSINSFLLNMFLAFLDSDILIPLQNVIFFFGKWLMASAQKN